MLAAQQLSPSARSKLQDKVHKALTTWEIEEEEEKTTTNSSRNQKHR
jgi:hypothetical protein